MRTLSLALILLCVPACKAQDSQTAQGETTQATAAPMRTTFQIRYINNSDVYIDGGRNSGLAVGARLVLKQDPGSSDEKQNKPIEPGVVAKLTVVSVASSSAVCQIDATSRELAVGDIVSLPDSEVQKIVEKDTLGNTRKYPLVISFSEGDPLDEEVRDQVPRPPLPEVNEMRGRIGFDVSHIRVPGQVGFSSTQYGFSVRADFTRIAGTHWNLNGYWRGELQSNSSGGPTTLQDLINRTYVMSLTYINPGSAWSAGVGRLYLPWASSLEVIDGGYLAHRVGRHSLTGIFAGSTPDPSAWDYDPSRRIGGAFFNVHGGSFEAFQYSSTVGLGIALQGWKTQRPFAFTENSFSYKRYFSVFESLQLDRPVANPSTPPVSAGVGESLLSLHVQVHPRVSLELTDTYLRDVPTYNAALVGTGLLGSFLYQGVNGGARVTFPQHVTGYFTLGRSSDSSDPKSSLNELFGVTITDIRKTGLEADVRYSRFNSAFANGTYRTLTVARNLGERFRMNLQGGNYSYNSSAAANNRSYFVNLLFDTNLGSHYFLENAFTSQRGGSNDYDQFTVTFGLRFNNRRRINGVQNGQHP